MDSRYFSCLEPYVGHRAALLSIAIFCYRLYDVDVVINRALVCGSLTLMLLLVYFGGVTATQALFQTLTGQQQP